jgi:hypothetical protein
VLRHETRFKVRLPAAGTGYLSHRNSHTAQRVQEASSRQANLIFDIELVAVH